MKNSVAVSSDSETKAGFIISEILPLIQFMTTEKNRYDYTDVLFWLGILMMTVWVIGKLAGLIHSPEGIEQLPIIGAIVAILSIGLKTGRILQKLDYVIEKTDKLDTTLKDHEKRITILEN